MDRSEFEAKLKTEGFDVAVKSLPPNSEIVDHAHDFEVVGLVIEGEFAITVDGQTTSYGPNERFTMQAGRVHAERTGDGGVTFLVGRR